MGFTVTRPSSIIDLPGLTVKSHEFVLGTRDMLMVFHYTKLFAETLREAKRDFSDVLGILTSSSSTRSILYATRAQQWAAHPALIPDPIKKDEQNLKKIQRRMQLQYSNKAQLDSYNIEPNAPLIAENTDTTSPAEFTLDKARQNTIAGEILRGESKAAEARSRNKQSSRPINDLNAAAEYNYHKIDDALSRDPMFINVEKRELDKRRHRKPLTHREQVELVDDLSHV